MIVFSQCEQYQNLIKNGFEKWPNARDLMIIAKEWYFMQKKGYSEISRDLWSFCAEKSPLVDEKITKNLIKKCVEKLKKCQNYTELPEKIVFFEEECEKISQIKNKEWQKIIFILCCLSKLKRDDGLYLNSSNTIKISDIFELANIKIPIKNQEIYFHNLKNENLLKVDLKPLLKIHPFCLLKEGKEKISLCPSEKMLEYLYTFNGTPTFQCCLCGETALKTNNRAKYCKSCAEKVHQQKKNESTRRMRTLRKNARF